MTLTTSEAYAKSAIKNITIETEEQKGKDIITDVLFFMPKSAFFCLKSSKMRANVKKMADFNIWEGYGVFFEAKSDP